VELLHRRRIIVIVWREGVWIEAKIREIKKGRLGFCDAVGWIDLLSISGSNIIQSDGLFSRFLWRGTF